MNTHENNTIRTSRWREYVVLRYDDSQHVSTTVYETLGVIWMTNLLHLNWRDKSPDLYLHLQRSIQKKRSRLTSLPTNKSCLFSLSSEKYPWISFFLLLITHQKIYYSQSHFPNVHIIHVYYLLFFFSLEHAICHRDAVRSCQRLFENRSSLLFWRLSSRLIWDT